MGFAYVVVDGSDEDDAFSRGCQGKGTPLWMCAPKTAVFECVFDHLHDHTARYEDRTGRVIAPDRWVSSFFNEHRGWAYADDVGIVLRYAHDLGERAKEWIRNPVFMDGRVLARMLDQKLRKLILAALTEPGEALEGDPNFGPTGLGDEPEFAAVCVRAMALLHMGEAMSRQLAVLRLPKPKAGDQQRFLFFGLRSVR